MITIASDLGLKASECLRQAVRCGKAASAQETHTAQVNCMRNYLLNSLTPVTRIPPKVILGPIGIYLSI